jgi:hypothetical protein
MTQESFLPEGFELPKKISQFLKLPTDGKQIRFRILSPSLRGWLMFGADKKPIRKAEETPFTPEELDAIHAGFPDGTKQEKPRYFWACMVLDREDEQFKVLEITQASIQQGIMTFVKDVDWGSVYDYDIKISRTNANGKVSYTCLTGAKEPLSEVFTKRFERLQYDLTALFRNEYPIND